MPIVYEYLGIKLGLYTDDHEPIHFHAMYNGNVIKVILHVENGFVKRVTYQAYKGTFSPTKLKQLKEFCAKYKQALLFAYEQLFNGVEIKRITITKKIK